MMDITSLLPPDYLIVLVGIAVFSITGVLAGARKGMDLFGIVILGMVTAFGGGTVRDIIIDAPVFWLNNYLYIIVALVAGVLAFFFESYFWKTYKPLLHLDALGIALFNVQAIDKTLALGYNATVAVLMGLLTGISGGMMRDVLTGRPNLLLKQELYATPILIGGILYIGLLTFVPKGGVVSAWIAIAVVFILRVAAIRWNLTYPKWLLFAGKESE